MDQELARRFEGALSPLGHGPEGRYLYKGLTLLLALPDGSHVMDGGAESSLDHLMSVLSHMIEIAVGEGFCMQDIRVGAATNVLHDIWPIQRISRETRW